MDAPRGIGGAGPSWPPPTSAADAPTLVPTWSIHQYQMEMIERPRRTPGHGKLSSSADRTRWRELGGGTAQSLEPPGRS